MLATIVLLTCLERQEIITNITEYPIDTQTKVELIQEVLKVSDCKDGYV